MAAPTMPASFLSSGRDERGADVDVRQELLGLLADAAADDDQIRPEQRLDELEVVLEPVGLVFQERSSLSRTESAA